MLERKDGTSHVVGAEVTWGYRDKERQNYNPLDRLSDDEIRGLWGVRVDLWTDAIAAKLRLLDPARACVTIGDGAGVSPQANLPPGKSLPPLPKGLRYLHVHSTSSEGLDNVDRLVEQTELRYLSIGLLFKGHVDLSVLTGIKQLRVLEARMQKLENIDRLSALGELRSLDLAYAENVSKVDFVRSLTKLRTLELSRTDVTDLSPLGAHLALTDVKADQSPVCVLPAERLPALRSMRVMATKVNDADVAVFRQSNPACEVAHRWTPALALAVAEADRVRIRTGGTCHRSIETEETLFETSDGLTIRRLIAGIAVDESAAGFHCMCCGEPSIEFYRGKEVIATLGFHHGRSLRWPGGWPSDAILTPASAEFLIAWLTERNVSGPQRQREAEAERARVWQRRLARASGGLSPELAKALAKGTAAFGNALEQEIREPARRVAVLLRLYGASNDSWTSLDGIDQTADDLLKKYPVEVLAAEVERALSSDDRQSRRGAARFWRSSRSPLEDWKPRELAPLYLAVLTVQQEARFVNTRIYAMQNLKRFSYALSTEEVDRRLAAGLYDPDQQVRRQAMLSAARLEHAATVPLLLKVLRGEATEARELPKVPESETVDIPNNSDNICGSVSDAEVAALALGYFKNAEAMEIIAAMQPLTPVFEVALALMGQGERLKQEHFQSPEDNQALQLAAVEAVVRSRGQYGLAYALQYETATHWWEPEYVAEQLSRMLREGRAPGSESLTDTTDLKMLKKWYDEYGAEYLSR